MALTLEYIAGRKARMAARMFEAMANGEADDAAWAARLLARAATIEAGMLAEVR